MDRVQLGENGAAAAAGRRLQVEEEEEGGPGGEVVDGGVEEGDIMMWEEERGPHNPTSWIELHAASFLLQSVGGGGGWGTGSPFAPPLLP